MCFLDINKLSKEGINYPRRLGNQFWVESHSQVLLLIGEFAAMSSPDCIFCKLASKKIPSDVVYEDDDVYAFNDLSPQAPVHVLVIPKSHLENIAAASEYHVDLVGRLFLTANKVAQLTGIAESGYRVIANVGKEGGQSVDHLHVHVLGGRQLAWPPG